jgi:hypothetical protein
MTKPNPMRTFAPAPQAAPAEKPPIQDAKPVQKAFRLTPSQAHELRKFCAAENITMQEAIIAGINMLMRSKGLPPI